MSVYDRILAGVNFWIPCPEVKEEDKILRSDTMKQERINSIIQQGKPMAERIAAVRERFVQAMDQFERFRALCRTALQDKEVAADFSELGRVIEASDRIIVGGGRA